MLVVFLIFAALAGLLHIYIFVLETFLWTSESAKKTFKTSTEQANQTKELAANQGVYNGTLAAIALLGVAVIAFGGNELIGKTLILASCSVMTVAALYLLATSKDKRNAALKQLMLPLLTLITWLFLL
jgi:putative membrane protein